MLPVPPPPATASTRRRQQRHPAHRHHHLSYAGARVWGRGGCRASAYTAGRPTGVRAYVGSAADVCGGCVRRHTFGPRRLRAIASDQARATRHRARVRTVAGTSAAAATAVPTSVCETETEKAFDGGQTAAAASNNWRPRQPQFADNGRFGCRFPIAGLPDSPVTDHHTSKVSVLR